MLSWLWSAPTWWPLPTRTSSLFSSTSKLEETLCMCLSIGFTSGLGFHLTFTAFTKILIMTISPVFAWWFNQTDHNETFMSVHLNLLDDQSTFTSWLLKSSLTPFLLQVSFAPKYKKNPSHTPAVFCWFPRVAQKREDAVSKEVTRKLSEADNRKMSRKEKDERWWTHHFVLCCVGGLHLRFQS